MTTLSIVREKLTLLNHSGDSLYADVRYAAESHSVPVVVLCHSFMAFKEWGFFPYLGEKLAEAGYVSVIMDFSHNGVINHGNRITEFEKFEHNTFRQELSDLTTVLDAITSGEIGSSRIDPARIVLFGHSRGGGIAIVSTAEDTRVRSLVTWSAISTFDRWTDHQKKIWRSRGYLPLARDSTISPLRLGVKLLEEYEQHRQELGIVEAARKIRVPWLIVHGKNDLTVQPREAEILFQAADRTMTDLFLVDTAGHLFNAASRSADGYRTLDHVLERTIDWLHQHLS